MIINMWHFLRIIYILMVLLEKYKMGITNTFLPDCSQSSYPKDLGFFFESGAHPRACYFILLDLLAPTLYAYIGSNISKENRQFLGDGFVHKFFLFVLRNVRIIFVKDF